MSKFIRETRARIVDAYGNRFVLLCVSSTNSELTTDLDETTKDECKARLYTGGAFITLLNSCSYCDETTVSTTSFGTILPMWFHSVLIYVCLQLAMVLILRVVNPMKTDKQIENICKEHVPNVILELSGKIR